MDNDEHALAEIDGQALIDKMTKNYGQSLAVKDQQLAMAEIQIDNLVHENIDLKKQVAGKKAK